MVARERAKILAPPTLKVGCDLEKSFFILPDLKKVKERENPFSLSLHVSTYVTQNSVLLLLFIYLFLS